MAIKLLVIADTADLKRLKKDVIHLFTDSSVNCERYGDNHLIVHTSPKGVDKILTDAGWLYDDRYKEWSHDEKYVLSVTGGGSASKIEFIFND
jgi:hypothetical protein